MAVAVRRRPRAVGLTGGGGRGGAQTEATTAWKAAEPDSRILRDVCRRGQLVRGRARLERPSSPLKVVAREALEAGLLVRQTTGLTLSRANQAWPPAITA